MKKKKHHYIPVFYLNNFTQDKFIWVYDKEDEKMFSATPENIAYEKHYYSLINEAGEKDTETIEHVMELIEGQGGEVLKKINSKERLDEKDKGKLIAFIACMFVRIPNYRINVEGVFSQTIHKLNKIIASNERYFQESYCRFIKNTNTENDISSEKIRQFMLNSQYIIKTNPLVSLYSGLTSMVTFGEIFFKMKWVFFLATDERSFLTCDNPVFHFDPTHDPNSPWGVGFMNKNVEITFPISRNICAIGGWQLNYDLIYIPGSNQYIKAINKRIISSAHRFIYSSEKNDKLLYAVCKYKKSSPKMVVR